MDEVGLDPTYFAYMHLFVSDILSVVLSRWSTEEIVEGTGTRRSNSSRVCAVRRGAMSRRRDRLLLLLPPPLSLLPPPAQGVCRGGRCPPLAAGAPAHRAARDGQAA